MIGEVSSLHALAGDPGRGRRQAGTTSPRGSSAAVDGWSMSAMSAATARCWSLWSHFSGGFGTSSRAASAWRTCISNHHEQIADPNTSLGPRPCAARRRRAGAGPRDVAAHPGGPGAFARWCRRAVIEAGRGRLGARPVGVRHKGGTCAGGLRLGQPPKMSGKRRFEFQSCSGAGSSLRVCASIRVFLAFNKRHHRLAIREIGGDVGGQGLRLEAIEGQ